MTHFPQAQDYKPIEVKSIFIFPLEVNEDGNSSSTFWLFLIVTHIVEKKSFLLFQKYQSLSH